jgi:hypothetical protein
MTRMLPTPVHVRHSYASCGRSLYVAAFHADSIEWDRFTAPDSTSPPGWVACETRLSFSPKCNYWNSVLKSNIYRWTCYIGLLDSYHQHVISTFNICSWGPTHRSLTDTGRGYNLRGTGLPHHTPRPFQSVVSTFHLRASSGLQFNQVLSTKPKFKFEKPMTATWSFDHSAIYRGLYLCLNISNDLSLVIGITKIDWKITLCN